MKTARTVNDNGWPAAAASVRQLPCWNERLYGSPGIGLRGGRT